MRKKGREVMQENKKKSKVAHFSSQRKADENIKRLT
jgi:hypothetical protein